jgi:hypothetical protein
VAHFGGVNGNKLAWTFVLNSSQPTRVFSQLELNPRRHDLALFIEVANPMRDFLHRNGFVADARQHAGRADGKIVTTRIRYKYLITYASFKNNRDIMSTAQLESSHALSDKVVDPIF